MTRLHLRRTGNHGEGDAVEPRVPRDLRSRGEEDLQHRRARVDAARVYGALERRWDLQILPRHRVEVWDAGDAVVAEGHVAVGDVEVALVEREHDVAGLGGVAVAAVGQPDPEGDREVLHVAVLHAAQGQLGGEVVPRGVLNDCLGAADAQEALRRVVRGAGEQGAAGAHLEH